jgi:hypothetical protein
MFKKICSSPENNVVDTHEHKEVLANPKLVRQLSKLASNIKSIAPKSDDFLYFSIIFLKSAESALLADDGTIKKTSSGEDAWGFFDEGWKWHGNVQPHRNNNKDIFPESELKKAASKWVGLPLCRDHESSSVDGIRGIILDTHYDEKFKQVVGLCALDKVNYPDLARKVQTGLVRYGSMGTAVETSVCSECLNKATTQKEYCQHILNKTAHGEINVGLKPIEYSLVVQPAEPGAILLKCIASLEEYSDEFINYGVDDVSSMLGSLSLKQAEHLEGIMKTACGDTGCSVSERKKIVRAFLDNNSLLKNSSDEFTDSSESARNKAEALKAVSQAANVLTDPGVPSNVKDIIANLIGELNLPSREDTSVTPTERFTTYENAKGADLPGHVREQSAVSSQVGFLGGGDTGNRPDFPQGDDVLSQVHPAGGEPLTGFAATDVGLDVKVANNNDETNDYVDDFSINSIVEEIMNESRMRKRAELRRRIAYMQGGADGAEPNTYKSEDYKNLRDNQDRQMAGTYDLNAKEREEINAKEKLSRAQLAERQLRRQAYMQGGAEGVEPNTFKSQDYKGVRDGQDKQMLQGGNMGGASGMWPGDSQAKENLHRASDGTSGLTKNAYNGPALSTKFSVRRNLDGSVDHSNSMFEVFAGDKRVVAATAGDIFGPELRTNWNWLKSREYGQEVCNQIRSFGLNYVSSLLKTAQEMPDLGGGEAEMPDLGGGEAEMPDLGGEAEMPDLGGGEAEMPDLGGEDLGGGEEEAEEEPAEAIDNRLAEIEQLLDEVRDLVAQLEDQRLADVDVNVFTGKDKGGPGEEVDAGPGGLGALSSQLVENLKTAYRRLDGSADELSMVAETYDNISKLSNAQAGEFVKLATSAVRDADQLTGETRALVRMANDFDFTNNADDAAEDTVEDAAEDTVNFAEDAGLDMGLEDNMEMDDPGDEAADGLVLEAMNLRRARREAILKQAEDRVLAERARSRESLLKSAEPTAVTDEVAEDAISTNDSAENATAETVVTSSLKEALNTKLAHKRADEERENYRVKLRRAYDVGMEMQNKGLLSTTKTALDKQVDEIMTFDDNAFEAFKRSIGNARSVSTMKIASDLGGVNIGVESDSGSNTSTGNSLLSAGSLSSMWD